MQISNVLANQSSNYTQGFLAQVREDRGQEPKLVAALAASLAVMFVYREKMNVERVAPTWA